MQGLFLFVFSLFTIVHICEMNNFISDFANFSFNYLLIISKYMVLLNCMFMRLRAPGIVENKVDIQGVRR